MTREIVIRDDALAAHRPRRAAAAAPVARARPPSPTRARRPAMTPTAARSSSRVRRRRVVIVVLDRRVGLRRRVSPKTDLAHAAAARAMSRAATDDTPTTIVASATDTTDQDRPTRVMHDHRDDPPDDRGRLVALARRRNRTIAIDPTHASATRADSTMRHRDDAAQRMDATMARRMMGRGRPRLCSAPCIRTDCVQSLRPYRVAQVVISSRRRRRSRCLVPSVRAVVEMHPSSAVVLTVLVAVPTVHRSRGVAATVSVPRTSFRSVARSATA